MVAHLLVFKCLFDKVKDRLKPSGFFFSYR